MHLAIRAQMLVVALVFRPERTEMPGATVLIRVRLLDERAPLGGRKNPSIAFWLIQKRTKKPLVGKAVTTANRLSDSLWLRPLVPSCPIRRRVATRRTGSERFRS